MHPTIRNWSALALAVTGSVAGCESAPRTSLEFVPATPHERYEYAFRKVGLEQTVLGHQWIAASFAALDSPPLITTPFEEVGYFDPLRAQSFGFRFEARRGQVLRVAVETETGGPDVFIDLFRLGEDADRPFWHVGYADSGSTAFDTPIRRNGEYVIRVQPEMLGEGRYTITVRLAASLAFPVAGHGMEAIRSGWGADRDGGRREHQGVDIFAPRGTPVLASSEGTISSTRPNTLGGRVVWLRTPSGESLYHAHLDSVHVRRGTRVHIGDTLGFVGNTGNARTTPPHLHFGVYQRGATDPYPFIYNPSQTPPRLQADESRVGSVSVAARPGVPLRSTPATRGPVLERLDADVPVTILGASGAWYRVRLPDSSMGFVGDRDLAADETVLDRLVVDGPAVLSAWPGDSSVSAAAVDRGDLIEVLGRFNDQVLVRAPGGITGWMPDVVLVSAAAGAN